MGRKMNFQKLDDGTWGVKVTQRRQTPRPTIGETVEVPKRAGGTSRVTLGALDHQWAYADTICLVYRIQSRDNGGGPRRTAQAPARNYTDWPDAPKADIQTHVQDAADGISPHDIAVRTAREVALDAIAKLNALTGEGYTLYLP